MASSLSSAVSPPAPAVISAVGQLAAIPLGAKGNAAKARVLAQDFEAVFLNAMFSHMATAADGEGPFGGGTSVGIWRSFLTEQYAKSFASAGGIGLADHVERALLAQQELRAPRA